MSMPEAAGELCAGCAPLGSQRYHGSNVGAAPASIAPDEWFGNPATKAQESVAMAGDASEISGIRVVQLLLE
jgi:hypothetical protein